MTPVELVLSKLPDVRRNGNGWMARCPAHDDERASLSVAVGDDGRALVHCHAGCTPEAIVSAMGLRLADLMPGDSGKPRAARRAKSKVKTKTGDGRAKDAPTVYATA